METIACGSTLAQLETLGSDEKKGPIIRSRTHNLQHHDDEHDEVPPARPSRGFGLCFCSFPVWSLATTEQQVRFGGSE